MKTPVLIIAGDADVVTLEHSVALFRLLGGGAMGDMGKPLAASRLAVMPATSHTAVITQPDLLHALIEPLPEGQTPKKLRVFDICFSTAAADAPPVAVPGDLPS